MFFQFKEVKISEDGEAGFSGLPPEDVNPDGSPKYISGPEGELIINDPSLLISREVSGEPPSKEDISLMSRFINGRWWPFAQIKFWADLDPCQQ